MHSIHACIAIVMLYSYLLIYIAILYGNIYVYIYIYRMPVYALHIAIQWNLLMCMLL